MLTTPDPPPAWRGAWRRRFAYAMVGAATLILGLAALAGLYGGLGMLIDAQAALIVAALVLMIRYPLLSWRLAWLALMIAVLFENPPLVPRPWNTVELPVLLATFWVAGARHGGR